MSIILFLSFFLGSLHAAEHTEQTYTPTIAGIEILLDQERVQHDDDDSDYSVAEPLLTRTGALNLTTDKGTRTSALDIMVYEGTALWALCKAALPLSLLNIINRTDVTEVSISDIPPDKNDPESTVAILLSGPTREAVYSVDLAKRRPIATLREERIKDSASQQAPSRRRRIRSLP